jgi:cell division protease FtsH
MTETSEHASAESLDTVASRLGGGLIDAVQADVGAARERMRRHRLRVLAVILGVPGAFLWWRILTERPFNIFALPAMPEDPILYVLPLVIILALIAVVAMPLASGRSPHVLFRPEQIDVTFDDVKGLDGIVDEVIKTLNTFLGYALYKDRLGGNPRRGLLFEGPPGTGKTYMAKAMARHAGVPFLYVSSTSFQSMWYGATARKIRGYFKQLRKAARKEGGAIGFIEEIDAIAMTRNGLNATPLPDIARMCATTAAPAVGAAAPGGVLLNRFGSSEGTGGVVNELLVQLQSFDTPPFGDKVWNAFAGMLNGYLPAHRQLQKRKERYNNILVIAATNRADSLDPALLRPGRFDRRLAFELPPKRARRDLIDYFLGKKAHDPELDTEQRREQLSGQTFGYTPVMIEHLFDEALVLALKSGRDALSWKDVQDARLTGEVGIKNPVEYTERERLTVATHESGHATVAYLSKTRRLEVLSIIKRQGSLGLLAHGDLAEEYTRSKQEMYALVDIAMGGMCAEEIFFGEAGTGPGGDLAYATQVACEIVGSSGMAGSLVSLAAVQSGALNDSNLVGRVLSDPHARPEVDRILAQSKAKVRALLDANRHLVEGLRDALLARDELIGEEITAVLEAAGEPVTEGLVIERRGDRRRRDWLAGESA